MTKPREFKEWLQNELDNMPMRVVEPRTACVSDCDDCLFPRQQSYDQGFATGARLANERAVSAADKLAEALDDLLEINYAHELREKAAIAREALKEYRGEDE